MTLSKNISIFLVVLFVTIVITSNTAPSQLSNNQVYALGNEIDETIKKSCPTYQGNNNNNIKGLVTDILKTCLHQGNTSEPPATPNPEPTRFDVNVMNLNMNPSLQDIPLTVTITDNSANKLNSYIINGQEVDATFVIPVGDKYVVNVENNVGGPTIPIDFDGTSNCSGINSTACSGTMSTVR